MGIHKVDQKSVSYRLLYLFVRIWHHFYFYKKVEVSHMDRVPKEGAMIFTPNHQNALMDALALLFTAERPIVFLARADIFKKQFIAEILYFLRILPVFRPRDGHSEVKKNQDTFDKTTEVLEKNYGLGIFPEGNHGDMHSLRVLKKGFARIAFQTEEGNDYKLDIQIVPVGILYSNYQNCGSVLSLNYGHPFSLSPYYEEYTTNPAVAYNKASEALAKEMKKYMIHIEDDEYYTTIDFLQTNFKEQILTSTYKDYTNRIESGRAIVEKLSKLKSEKPNAFENLHDTTQNFLKKSKGLNAMQQYLLVHWKWSSFIGHSLLFLMSLPFLLVSHLVLLFPTGITFFATSKIKDPQFKSSIKFVVALFSFFLFFIIEQFIFNYFKPNCPWYKFLIIYTVSLLIVSQTAAWLRMYFNKLNLFKLWVFRSTSYKELRKMLSNIENLLNF